MIDDLDYMAGVAGYIIYYCSVILLYSTYVAYYTPEVLDSFEGSPVAQTGILICINVVVVGIGLRAVGNIPTKDD